MWTVIRWDRLKNQWLNMSGYSDESRATEVAKDSAETFTPDLIVSLADPTGDIVWAAIGQHPVIGRCDHIECWCYDHPNDEDHTLSCEGHQIGRE